MALESQPHRLAAKFSKEQSLRPDVDSMTPAHAIRTLQEWRDDVYERIEQSFVASAPHVAAAEEKLRLAEQKADKIDEEVRGTNDKKLLKKLYQDQEEKRAKEGYDAKAVAPAHALGKEIEFMQTTVGVLRGGMEPGDKV